MFYSSPNDKRPQVSSSLWRYMSLSKLIQMLESRSIWFTRVDQLIRDDPFEGSIPYRFAPPAMTEEQQKKDALYEQRHRLTVGAVNQMRTTRLAMHRVERVRTYVSCWHASKSDSDAMWRLYGAEKDGSVCVQTTAARAFDQLPHWVMIGRVSYKSYDTDVFPTDNSFSSFFHKRACFSHENEVRLLANPLSVPMDSPWNPEAVGIPVGFDPDSFLLRICVSPTSPEWFLHTVTAVVRKFDISVPVERAPMSMKPVV